MTEHIPTVATALIPLTSLVSLSIYISSHPRSLARRLFRSTEITLPTQNGEGLLPEKDPFDIHDGDIHGDGTALNPERFWASTRRRKIGLLATFLIPFAANIALLVLSVQEKPDSQPFDPVIPPALLLPSHVVTILLAVWYLSHNDTASHWATTIHITAGIFVQFIVLAIIALLPHEPFPQRPESFMSANFLRSDLLSFPDQPIPLLRALLPIVHFIPLLVVLFIRRGPPLFVQLDELYPPKIVQAIPVDNPSLDPTQSNVCEEVQATIPEWLMFGYVTNVVKKGYYSETMDVWDLPVLTSNMRALSNYHLFKNVYGRHTKRLGSSEGYNLLKKIAKANIRPITAQMLLTVFTAVAYYVPHWLLQQLLEYLQNDPTRQHPSWGWLLAFGLFTSNALVYIVSSIVWSISTTTLQGRIKLQLNTLLFSKTLRKKDVAAVTEDSEKDGEDEEEVASKAQIMTLFTVDVDRVTDFVFHAFAFVDSPIELTVATLYLVQLLGRSAVYGLLTAILCLPLNHLASKVVVTAQEGLMKARDQRTALMNEILQGIRMLKFMAWERSFEKRVKEIRDRELHWQARNYTIEICFTILWAITPVMVTVVAFLHFTLVAGHTLTPAIAFTSVAVFGELQYALNALPETFINALKGFVSCRRIEKYLAFAEVDMVEATAKSDIILTNATFTFARNDSALTSATPKNAFTLADLTLRFPQGELSLICGRLGSGKSLLLLGLLGEADMLAGSVVCPRSKPDLMAGFPAIVSDKDWIIPGQVGYVPQQAWLQNASIRDNVVFSSPWNPERYRRVLEACSLLSDLDILEDGDETEIGEKGLNLSGGQKARVSLARAVYSRAGVLLMDDVLSAVDAHTAHAIMENCIQGEILEGRTVLLVSHHTALVSPAAAYIVALDNGDVKFSGTRADFVGCGLMNELDADENKGPASPIVEKTVEEATKAIHKSVVSLNGTVELDSETSSIAPEEVVKEAKPRPPRKLMEDEKRAKGRIARDIWVTYFKSLGGPIWWILFALGQIIAMLLPVAERYWLKLWTGTESNQHSSTFYISGYALITLGGAFLAPFVYVVMYYGSIQASRKLHSKMLESVLFAKLRFHDTTSKGRIINRFGKDIEGLDSSMADNFTRSLSYGLSVAVTFISIMSVGGVPFLIAGGIMLVVYYQAGSIYGQTSRDMRRLDSITRSPLYSLFGETVSGIAVYRAFGASTIALKRMMQISDTNNLCFFWTWTVNRWLSARFNLLSSLMIGITALIVLISPGVTAAMAGFALAFASGVTHNLLFVVRRFVQLEQSMVALERIKEYSELELEAPEFADPRPSAAWPDSGAISVEKLSVRYAPELPNVLHGISFDVKPREKIGCVGATGCGKSTLALSFFRFVEAHEGRIVIDGIDISKIGLTDLRSKVTIIPQDPTILSGTLRSTLDVFDEYDDVDIYAALRRVHLLNDTDATGSENDADETRNKNVFRDLNNPVSEGGDNFSSGEKQLICMARAILKRNKVLFMDEATASIDYETDELISKTIREEFSESTIVTIAHRIHTIIDFDKVLVMNQGRIAEFASPAELLRDHKSRFYSLCKATGHTEFRNLKEMAMEAERKRA